MIFPCFPFNWDADPNDFEGFFFRALKPPKPGLFCSFIRILFRAKVGSGKLTVTGTVRRCSLWDHWMFGPA